MTLYAVLASILAGAPATDEPGSKPDLAPDVLAKIEVNMARGHHHSFYLRKGDGLRWHKERGRARAPARGLPRATRATTRAKSSRRRSR